jgi:amino acid transporter
VKKMMRLRSIALFSLVIGSAIFIATPIFAIIYSFDYFWLIQILMITGLVMMILGGAFYRTTKDPKSKQPPS